MAEARWDEVFNPAELEKLQRDNPFKKLNDSVCELLENAIISYSIPPSTKLSPVKIALSLGVSRSPVTDALETLAQRGLVKSASGKKGYYVFELSHVSLRNLFNARIALEGTAAYLCAQRNMELRLPDLERLAKLFYASFEKQYFNRYAMIDQAFHNLLIDSCGNPLIAQMYRSIERLNTYYSIRSQDYLKSMGDSPELQTVAGQHLTIYRAIEMGMPDMAQQALKDHLNMGYIMGMHYHITIGNDV